MSRRISLVIPIAVLSSVLYSIPALAEWRYPHGTGANTGFARVDTLPADHLIRSAPLGPMAPGANPVVGLDGTVFVGNLFGQLFAFHPDGKPYWTRNVNYEHGSFNASPVIAADGSIFVVSTAPQSVSGSDTLELGFASYLHQFSPGGAWLNTTPFPERVVQRPDSSGRGATTASPNIWYMNGVEAVMVPVVYGSRNGRDLRLLAYSTATGTLLADKLVTSYPPDDWDVGPPADHFNKCANEPRFADFPMVGWCLATHFVNGMFSFLQQGFEPAGWPLPNVAIWQNPNGGTPWVMVSDGRRDVVGYTFNPYPGPNSGFLETFRVTNGHRVLTSPPVVLFDGHTVVGDWDGNLKFLGPNGLPVPQLGNLGSIAAAPTLLADGRLVVIGRGGYMTIVRNNVIDSITKLAGESIASAAASCTHLFVSTTEQLVTRDIATMTPVATLALSGGGGAAPVIGPAGHVYVIVQNTLGIFPAPPPPKITLPGVPAKTACDKNDNGKR